MGRKMYEKASKMENEKRLLTWSTFYMAPFCVGYCGCFRVANVERTSKNADSVNFDLGEFPLMATENLMKATSLSFPENIAFN
ncbi:hypothetical protein CEXT_796641 [Caerostris extrusa]|uniref:Uncharacterized protein n=1 Tax=Caerostris extrusa TaxID=172846 RepID=A0AAV4NM11_CAEEX|nr:hypothetical protein CEXT_796641 [Caerostris extrusa]